MVLLNSMIFHDWTHPVKNSAVNFQLMTALHSTQRDKYELRNLQHLGHVQLITVLMTLFTDLNSRISP